MNRTPLDSVEEELKKFVDESDRGCVLLLAARLDAFLNELHQRYIIAKASPPKQTLNELFRHGRHWGVSPVKFD